MLTDNSSLATVHALADTFKTKVSKCLKEYPEAISCMQEFTIQVDELVCQFTDLAMKAYEHHQENIILKHEFAERCSRVYTFLEFIAHNHTRMFTDSEKGSLRKAQTDMQRLRLWLKDDTQKMPSKKT